MWSYNGFSKLQLDLITRRVIDLAGEVDIEMAKYTRESLLRLRANGSPDIEVRITSGGGSVEFGLDIYDMVRLYEGKTRGVVFGQAASMAAVILQACSQRCAAENTRILIHHINRNQVTLDDMRQPKKIAKIHEEMEQRQKRLYEILSQRTGKSIARIRAVCVKNEDMTARQALDFGLIDHVL